MNGHVFSLNRAILHALPTGALYWPEQALLVVSDLHFGKSARLSAVGGAMLPPYDTQDTLIRLEDDLTRTDARTVVCLGDSFDTADIVQRLPEQERLWITKLQAGRNWIWIEGNHDPGPVALGGAHKIEHRIGPLTFRHIADPLATGEVSGHYHPKAKLHARGRAITRPCFLVDGQRLVMPAFGTFTGGLYCETRVLQSLMAPDAMAILTGKRAIAIPMPRSANTSVV